MAPARNRTIALLVTLLVAASGCSRAGSEQGPTAPLATAEPSEAASPEPTETASPDPYAIPEDPDDIDAAYVERVLAELVKPISAATQEVVRTGRMNVKARRLLASTHTGQALDGTVDAYRDALRNARAQNVFSSRPKPVEVTVRRVIGRSRDCVFVAAMQDTSGLAGQEIEPFLTYYELEPKRDGDDLDNRNPTPWMIAVDALPRTDGRKYKDPCE